MSDDNCDGFTVAFAKFVEDFLNTVAGAKPGVVLCFPTGKHHVLRSVLDAFPFRQSAQFFKGTARPITVVDF